MTGTEVATTQGSGTLALRGNQLDWTDAQRAALAQIGIAEASAGDQQVFLHVAQRTGLDPFARQIYMIGRNDKDAPGGKKWTIQTGIDGFRVISERHPQYAGVGDAEWCGEDGVWRDVWVSKKPPIAARFTVYRKDWEHPVRAVAHYDEYVQTKFNGDPTSMWATKAAHMLAKCAEALARRRSFPQDLANVYSDDEMAAADNPPPVIIQAERDQPAQSAEPDWDAELAQRRNDPQRIKELLDLARGVRRNDGPLLNKISQAWQDAKTAATSQPEPAAERKPSKARMNRLFGLLEEAGAKTAEKRHRLASHALNRDITSFTDLTAGEVEHLVTRLEELKTEGKFPAAATTEPAPTDAQQAAQPADTEGDQQ